MSQKLNRMFFFPLITFFVQIRSTSNDLSDHNDHIINSEELKKDQEIISNMTRNEWKRLLRCKIFAFYKILLDSERDLISLKILLEDILCARYFLSITNYSDKCILYYDALLDFFKQKFDNLNVNERNLKKFSLRRTHLFSPTNEEYIFNNRKKIFDLTHEYFDKISPIQLYNISENLVEKKEKLKKIVDEKQNPSNERYPTILQLKMLERYNLIENIPDNTEQIENEDKNKENFKELEELLKSNHYSDYERKTNDNETKLIQNICSNLFFDKLIQKMSNNEIKFDMQYILHLMRNKILASDERKKIEKKLLNSLPEETKFLREAEIQYSKEKNKSLSKKIDNRIINIAVISDHSNLIGFDNIQGFEANKIPNFINPRSIFISTEEHKKYKKHTNKNNKLVVTTSDWKRFTENLKNFNQKINFVKI